MIKGKNIFITGGAGFIGSTLIEYLVDDNRITIYDNFHRDALSTKSYLNHRNISIIRGDILNVNHLRNSMANTHIVVHCAAIAGIDTVIVKPTDTMRVNMLGTAHVLEVAKELNNLERFISFSTSEVFGQSAFRVEEDQTTHIGAVGEARWTYAVSKLAAEHLTKAYNEEFGMPTVTLRPFNIYGPGQVGDGALRAFIQQAIQNEDIHIHGDGNQIRAWCYIDDFIDGLLRAMERPEAVGESFNIGNARAVMTIYGLAQTVVRVLQSSSQIKFSRRHYADVELRVPGVKKAKELIGFEAKIDLEEGIRRSAEYFGGIHNEQAENHTC